MDIASLRKEFNTDRLDREELDDNPYAQFKLWFDQACQAGIVEPNALTLGTADQAGRVYQRTVLMKAYDEQGIVFYTDSHSNKSRQIAENHQVSLLFHWLELDRQVIIGGTAEKVGMAESLKYFANRLRGTHIGDWVSVPSQVMSTRRVLEMKLDEMKRKFKSGEVPLPDSWIGYRVVPRTIEFWQAGAGPLHDRFLYTHQDAGNWIIERLSP